MKFKICEQGGNQPVLGLENLSPDHAQLLRLAPLPGGKPVRDLKPGESGSYRDGTKNYSGDNKKALTEVYTVVRTE